MQLLLINFSYRRAFVVLCSPVNCNVNDNCACRKPELHRKKHEAYLLKGLLTLSESHSVGTQLILVVVIHWSPTVSKFTIICTLCEGNICFGRVWAHMNYVF